MLKDFFKKHYLIIVVALVIGAATFYPHYGFIKSLGAEERGINKSFIDDDLYYLSRAKDVIDGHSLLANPSFFEHKNSWPMQFWLPDYILSKPLAVLGIDVNQGYNFYSFLLPCLLAILSYFALYSVSQSRALSLIGVLFLHGIIFFRLFSRLPSPGFSFIFWLTLFNFLLAYLKGGKKIFIFLSLLNFGLLFYIYPYYWTFFAILLVGFLIFGKIFLKNFPYKNYLLILAGGFVLGSYYFFELWQSAKLPYYGDSLARLGLLQTHFPSGLKIVALAFIIVLAFFILWRKKIIIFNDVSLFLTSTVLAGVIAVNQHVITGKNLEFSSHYWPESAFGFVFAGIYAFNLILQKTKLATYQKSIKIIVILILTVWAAFHIYGLASKLSVASKQDSYWQNYAPIFEWLNKNSAKDEVVFANNDLSNLIPIYTANNVYFNQSGTLFFMSGKEVEERYAISRYFETIDYQSILREERIIWGTRYINQYAHNQSKNKLRRFLFLKPVNYEKIPPSEINRVLKDLAEIKKLDFKEALNKYQIDYLVWDKNQNPNWQLDRYDFLKKVYSLPFFIIYKINK